MSSRSDDTNTDLDPTLIQTMIEQMDQDVATRFVASALSLDKRKIKEAYALACREMYIREQEKDNEVEATDQNLSAPDLTNDQIKKTKKDLIDSIQSIFSQMGSGKNAEVEIDIVEPDDDDDSENKK